MKTGEKAASVKRKPGELLLRTPWVSPWKQNIKKWEVADRFTQCCRFGNTNKAQKSFPNAAHKLPHAIILVNAIARMLSFTPHYCKWTSAAHDVSDISVNSNMYSSSKVKVQEFKLWDKITFTENFLHLCLKLLHDDVEIRLSYKHRGCWELFQLLHTGSSCICIWREMWFHKAKWNINHVDKWQQ